MKCQACGEYIYKGRKFNVSKTLCHAMFLDSNVQKEDLEIMRKYHGLSRY